MSMKRTIHGYWTRLSALQESTSDKMKPEHEHEENNPRILDTSVSSPVNNYNGLQNQGSTCYLNSVLQVLYMTGDFREAVERHCCKNPDTNNIDPLLKSLFGDLKEREARTHLITGKLGIRKVHEQQDAAEYFEKILRLTSDEASQIFHGKLTHRNTCSACTMQTDADGPFWSLPLSMIHSSGHDYSVMDGIEAFFRPSEFSGENQMYCDGCDAKADATIECKMKDHPEVLMLLLKRFEFDYNDMQYVKINCSVDVPRILQIPESPMYELYEVVEHFGDQRSGHYIAIIKSQDDDRWYEFNDTRVTLLDRQPFQGDVEKSHSAYLLIYRKNKDAPDTSTNNQESSSEGHRLDANHEQGVDPLKDREREEGDPAAEEGKDTAERHEGGREETEDRKEASVRFRGAESADTQESVVTCRNDDDVKDVNVEKGGEGDERIALDVKGDEEGKETGEDVQNRNKWLKPQGEEEDYGVRPGRTAGKVRLSEHQRAGDGGQMTSYDCQDYKGLKDSYTNTRPEDVKEDEEEKDTGEDVQNRNERLKPQGEEEDYDNYYGVRPGRTGGQMTSYDCQIYKGLKDSYTNTRTEDVKEDGMGVSKRAGKRYGVMIIEEKERETCDGTQRTIERRLIGTAHRRETTPQGVGAIGRGRGSMTKRLVVNDGESVKGKYEQEADAESVLSTQIHGLTLKEERHGSKRNRGKIQNETKTDLIHSGVKKLRKEPGALVAKRMTWFGKCCVPSTAGKVSESESESEHLYGHKRRNRSKDT